MARILIIEDADSLRDVLGAVLEHEGFIVDSFATAEEGIEAVKNNTYTCILSDYRLPKKSGIEFLEEVREISKTVPFIIMTAFGSIDISVEAMKKGANDFICKPFEPQEFCDTVHQIIEHRRVVDRALGLHSRRERRFMTKNAKTEKLLHQAKKVARVDSAVLITGESGAGKELIARYIHQHSERRDKPFVAVNCAALPPDLLESEFFGHEAGAFTGATQSRIGVFEYASEGTIFLDEVGDMPASLQVKLLRALQENEIKPVGSNKTVRVSPRVVSATNCNIDEWLENGKMREDFFYRIAVVSFHIPPLRERKEDLEMLADAYMKSFCEKLSKPEMTMDEDAKMLINGYSWPGNARELENVIERAVIMAEECIKPEHLGININLDIDAINEAALTLPEIAGRAAREAEFKTILKALEHTQGNKTKAAQMLGVSYKTLLNKVKEYDIQYRA